VLPATLGDSQGFQCQGQEVAPSRKHGKLLHSSGKPNLFPRYGGTGDSAAGNIPAAYKATPSSCSPSPTRNSEPVTRTLPSGAASNASFTDGKIRCCTAQAAESACGSAERSLRPAKPKKAVFDFRAHFCHAAPMETHAFGVRLFRRKTPGQRPEGPKAISYQ
jgi:hypothetical protein